MSRDTAHLKTKINLKHTKTQFAPHKEQRQSRSSQCCLW